MGDVVMFKPRSRPAGADAVRANSGGAEILFFLGVRYERDPETPVVPPTTEKPLKSSSGTPRTRRRKRPA